MCVFGGWSDSFVDTVEEYDDASDRWTELTKARMPQFGRAYFGIATLALSGANDTLVYIVGGHTSENRKQSTVLRFSATEKQWLSTDACSLPPLSSGDSS